MIKRCFKHPARLMVMLVALTMVSAIAFAGDPPCDFSDDFYRQNGLNPANIRNRVNGMDGVSVPDPNCSQRDPSRRDVRIIETTVGYNNAGNVIFYTVMGMVMPDTFTNDAAGDRARQIANQFRAFLFPKKAGDPISPALPNRRQDNVFDTTGGYFSNNPLGLWIITFLSYTDSAFNTAEGQKMLADLAAKNGLDLDGTPLVNNLSDIENLIQKGFFAVRQRAQDGSEGFPWVI